MKPEKVEYCIIIKENKTQVENLKNKTTVNIVKIVENAFLDIDINEIIREAEEMNEGGNIFNYDYNNSSMEEEYDNSDDDDESYHDD